ncbi:hypothetical protein MY5147_010026 [Beauveria neobassiana]
MPSDLYAEVTKRSDPPLPPKTVTAEVASKMKSPGGGKDGLFYRGDSRPPAVVFAEGFSPQGSNQNLQNHLSFAGNSGLVSVTRSPQPAESIYPLEKNPAVTHNQEFAVISKVPKSSISHAYEVTSDQPSASSTKIKNNNTCEKLEDPSETLPNEEMKNELLDRCEVFRQCAEDITNDVDPD